MEKPTILPIFADEDIIDPVSGKNNVETPPAPYNSRGWGFKTKPPRQYFNWLHRWTYRWIEWLDAGSGEGSIPVKLYAPGGALFTAKPVGDAYVLDSGEILFDLFWKKINGLVFLFPDPALSSGFGVFAPLDIAIGVGGSLRIAPRDANTWPDAFLKTHIDDIIILAECDSEKVPGKIFIPPITSKTEAFAIYCSQPSTQGNSNSLESGNFGFTPALDNGFRWQAFCFAAP